MSQLLLAVWKAKVIERVDIKHARRNCTWCGGRKATIKLGLPHIGSNGRLYRFDWMCEPCYTKYYEKSKAEHPDASDIPLTRAEIVAKLFPKREKTKKGKTPDEIIREILDSQQDPAIIERARYKCHLMNIVKILKKYGDDDLALLVQNRLDSLI